MNKQEEIMKEAKERYEHLKKAYGEHDPYVTGFRACMQILKNTLGQTEQENDWRQALLNTFLGGDGR